MTITNRNPFNRETLVGEVLEGWQNMLNLAAELLHVPAGLITRIDGSQIEIFLSSKSEGNPYPEGFKTKYPESGFYCEWVAKNRKPMLLPDARENAEWKDNAAVKMNMVSYLGMPIIRPDGEVFGTICFLDCRKNQHNDTILKLVGQFKRMIELNLSVLFANEEIRKRDMLFDGLSQIFPICAYCKQVRTERQEWVPVESYIRGISGHRASHGVCPKCLERELGNDSLQ
jgi:GAF domain-containing protein